MKLKSKNLMLIAFIALTGLAKADNSQARTIRHKTCELVIPTSDGGVRPAKTTENMLINKGYIISKYREYVSGRSILGVKWGYWEDGEFGERHDFWAYLIDCDKSDFPRIAYAEDRQSLHAVFEAFPDCEIIP